MLQILTDPNAWIAFATLTALELVLGIDNIIFISILVNKLPHAQREMTRRIGLFLAMFMRIGLLLTLSWLASMTAPLLSVSGFDFSGRDLVLLFGGLFLLWKSVGEIHDSFEGIEGAADAGVKSTFFGVVLQIMLIDLVFSLDSIITAVGMVEQIAVMIAAVVASVGMMMLFANPIGRFISEHPTIKMLALSFLVVVAVVLIAEGFGHHVPKGYIYTAMGFSLMVEMLNIRLRKRSAQARASATLHAHDEHVKL
ncbi:MAG TPA: TerC family protein [Noviherbaspirillum sp.]|uniref:TerC family protein n=1 Tax=Noviherbaspirillum sp. TaxID=1926288 RepID=UPI002B4A616E|nr:TerC family protein [Noviherbaspirillum sp.]HJV87481.1 TerC family protein [Noviherbaspirillum sp.]